MGLSFANPLGFLALSALPAILAIHLFQRRARKATVSTLFLLEPARRESRRGRRIERLRQSASLWLQLCAALLLTWILVQPRWIREESVQRIVVVLDSSASMSAFAAPLRTRLERRLRRFERTAARTEWILGETDPRAGTLYAGADLADLLNAVKGWEPRLGAHEVLPALRTAAGIGGDGGAVVFVTDHVCDVPPGVELLAVGRPTDNVGLAGPAIDARGPSPGWRAVVCSFASAPQRRTWWVETPSGKSPPLEITLDPGGLASLSGAFPEGETRLVIALSGDAFTLDDRMPVVLPEPKILQVALVGEPPDPGFAESLLGSFDAIRRVDPEAPSIDLRFAWVAPEDVPSVPAPAVVFLLATEEPGPYSAAPVVAQSDPLTDGLEWRGLLVRENPGVERSPGDRVLVWQGERPLVLLRRSPEGSVLLFNFAQSASNLARLPAPLLLIHRFVENVRAGKRAPERKNVETLQRLRPVLDPDGPEAVLTIEPPSFGAGSPSRRSLPPGPVRAPGDPGFFRITQGERSVLSGAAHFADVREGDLRDADSRSDPRKTDARLIEANSRPDPLAPFWVVVLAGLLLADWHLQSRRRTS